MGQFVLTSIRTLGFNSIIFVVVFLFCGELRRGLGNLIVRKLGYKILQRSVLLQLNLLQLFC